MRGFLLLITLFLSMATMAQNNTNIKTESPYGASETATRIVENNYLKNSEILAVFYHTKNAENYGLNNNLIIENMDTLLNNFINESLKQ